MGNEYKRGYYAADRFPWVNLPQSLTFHGLLSSRKINNRQDWGKVLCGTDEDFLEYCRRFPVAEAESGVPKELEFLFTKHIFETDGAESLILNHSPLQHYNKWTSFIAGFKAAHIIKEANHD